VKEITMSAPLERPLRLNLGGVVSPFDTLKFVNF
jgi:hypothetical protein